MARPKELRSTSQDSCGKTTRTHKKLTRILPQDQKNFLWGGGCRVIFDAMARPKELTSSS